MYGVETTDRGTGLFIITLMALVAVGDWKSRFYFLSLLRAGLCSSLPRLSFPLCFLWSEGHNGTSYWFL